MSKTKKITTLDRTTAKQISIGATKILNDYFKSQGITIKNTGGTIYPDRIRFKFDFSIPEVKEKADTDTFNRYCSSYGLKSTDLGKKFKLRNTIYTITGISPSRPKNPINCSSNRGKQFIFPDTTVVRLLKTSPSK